MAQLFGTDGIRGVANTELTPELTVGLGRALVRTLREEGVARPLLVIGRDPRVSGAMLEGALVAGITSAGGDVTLLGVLPTPGVAWATTTARANGGVMISASHNPVEDNGIKCFGADGYKLTDVEEDRVEELLQRSDEDRPTGTRVGRVVAQPDLPEGYAKHLVDVAAGTDLSRLRVVVDCANGAASAIAPAVYQRLGCEVTAINARPDGDNINAGCGSTHPEVVAGAVLARGADLGLAHDGDADRLIAVDTAGQVVDGDAILALLAARLQARSGLDTVVTTTMTNLGFHHAMAKLDIAVIATDVGDRYVLEAMRAGRHPLGGEQSGHIIVAEHATTGDGILTGVLLLQAVADSGQPLSDLAAVMRRLPQVLVNVRGVDREGLAGAAALWDAVAEEEAVLGGAGRVLVRASGTEPMVRVMVEAETHTQAAATAERLASVVRTELG